MIFMQMFGIKCKKMCNGLEIFKWLVMQEKALWMALYARELKTGTLKYAVEAQ